MASQPQCTGFYYVNYIWFYVEIKCQLDATEVFIADLIACSTCFGHHYAHREGNRLYKTACGVSLDVLAAVVWSWDTSWAQCVNAGI